MTSIIFSPRPERRRGVSVGESCSEVGPRALERRALRQPGAWARISGRGYLERAVPSFRTLFLELADMQTPDDHSTLRRLVEAGGWCVVISYGRASQMLAATRGAPRNWRQFETLAGYLKELGIVECRVNTAKFAPSALPRPSAPARRRRPRLELSDLAAKGRRR